MLYICDLFFILSLIFIAINNLIKTDALVFCIFFRISPTIFWMIAWMKKVNNFQKAKVQPQGFFILLGLLPISA